MKLSEIILPSQLDSFLSHDWNSRPLKFDGDEEKFTKLPTISDLIQSLGGVLRDKRWSAPRELMATASKLDEEGQVSQRMNVPYHQAQQLYNDGFTICFGDISHLWSELEELRNDALLLGDLASEVVITCYLSPPNSSGVLHFDRQHNFFLQVEGTKHWTVSLEPGTRNPINNFLYPQSTEQYITLMKKLGYEIKLPSECARELVVLHPGEGLYLPPGHYHVPETQGSPSLHFTLTLEPVSFWSLLNPSVYRALLKHSVEFNEDMRFLDKDSRNTHLTRQRDTFVDFISNLSTDELIDIYLEQK